jgi:rubrerythrin
MYQDNAKEKVRTDNERFIEKFIAQEDRQISWQLYFFCLLEE